MVGRACKGIISVFGSLIVTSYLHMQAPWDAFATPARYLVGLAILFHMIDYVWTIYWWVTYVPSPPKDDNMILPYISVVMPVYNESSFVYHAIRSIILSQYPKDRMEVIVVDDGSLDDSWAHINTAATSLSENDIRHRIYRHKQNRGKRYALRKGFRAATGEIIVSLDSDSILEKDTLTALVTPFVHHRELGGVAGHLRVLNLKKGIIPRLLNVLFDAYGNIPRAAQSTACGAVTILPGALSAYRAVAVGPLLQSLCETTFWGKPMKHGEDIELTLGLLRSGWTTSYQCNAIVNTIAPETVEAALLTYTRWERSSLVYLFSGLIHLVCKQTFHPLYKRATQSTVYQYIARNEIDGIQKPVKGSQQARKIGTVKLGTLFLLLNLVSTATKNVISPFILYAQMRRTTFHPLNLSTSFIAILLLSGFQNLLIYGNMRMEEERDNLEDDEQAENTRKDDFVRGYNFEDASLYHESSRRLNLLEKVTQYSSRLQDTAVALIFHTGIITWSTIIAICTLRSQAWLTR